ncbi:MAG TPA: HEAT repeat domain-containing protein, partial [Polyangia bacterium]
AASGEELDAVVELLGTLGDRRATGPLTDELASGRLLRERVVGALGAIAHRDDPRPIPTLVGLLGDPDLSVRRRAAQAIAGLTDARAESALVTAARDPDREVRLIAIGELGRLRAPHAVAALTSALTCSSGAGCDVETAAAAARALGAIGDEHASEPLLSALDRPEARLRRDAADALARLRPPAIALAPELLRRIRVGAADRRLDALAALAGVLRGRPNPTATELSLGLVEGDDTQSAEVAAGALAAMLGPCAGCNAEPAARRLERRLGRADHDPELRRSLVAALGELGVDGTRGTLTARLARDSDPLVRAEAAWALGKKAAPDGKIAPALERALADADPAVRANAAAAIYRTARTQGAVAPHSGALTRLLADPDPAVRADAALALGLDPDARPALARLGDDPDPRVRAAASSALAKRPPGAPADFVAIHVVDFDGAPLAGARYRLTLPDGSIKLGATDGRGDVREESAPRGGCALELLDGH